MSDKKKRNKISRRDLLKLAGATGIAAVPALVGLDLMYDSKGDLPGEDNPYVENQSFYGNNPGNQPILVLYNDRSENPFGSYIKEILLAEGVNCFDFIKVSELKVDDLSRHTVVLLSEGPLDQSQVDMISGYVFNGGGLVAMRPDANLITIFGLKKVVGGVDQGYVIVDGASELSQGIVPVALQYYGAATNYSNDSAEVIAWFSDKGGTKTNHPAVTSNRFGSGWACMWAYDLAMSVVLSRQGNPDWVGQERDGFDGVRPSDLFYGGIDLERIEIPQADEQQRLLINILNFLSEDKQPIPRLWYFPAMSKSMLIATSDAHMNPGSAVEAVISRVENFGGHISVYYLPPNYSLPRRAALKVRWWLADKAVMDDPYLPTPSDIADWRRRGHEFGLHPLVEDGFEKGWKENWNAFTGLGYGPVSPTTRVHRILWDGWVESAKMQAEYGFRMNLDFYHVGDGFRKKNGEWVFGHFTGSGLPMKFIDENGKLINIYQQLTHLADDHILNLHWGGSVRLPAEQAIGISRSLFDRSLSGGYAALGAIFHADPYAEGKEWSTEAGKWLDGTLEYAVTQGIPIWSAEEWLNFVDARHNALVDNIHWTLAEKRLSFSVETQPFQLGSISVLLPWEHSKARLSGVEVNGNTIEYKEHVLGAQSYAWFRVEVGKNTIEAFYI